MKHRNTLACTFVLLACTMMPAGLASARPAPEPGPALATAYPDCTSSSFDWPHYSSIGAVVVKLRIYCKNPGAGTYTIKVKITGKLYYTPGGTCSPNVPASGPPSTRWSGTSLETNLTVNSSNYVTAYVPPPSAPKQTLNGSYYATANIYTLASGATVYDFANSETSAQKYTGPACPNPK